MTHFRAISVALVITLLGALTSCDQWSLREVENTKHQGETIRSLLERFRADAGSYPPDLAALTTKYSVQIPAPTVGKRQWNYEVFNDGASYALSVRIVSQSEPLLQATSESGWTFDTK